MMLRPSLHLPRSVSPSLNKKMANLLISRSSNSSSSSNNNNGALNTKLPNPIPFKTLLFLITIISLFYLFLLHHPSPTLSQPSRAAAVTASLPISTSVNHLLFSIASSARSFPSRKPYIRLWYSPNTTRALVYLDKPSGDRGGEYSNDIRIPPVVISGGTSKFPYTFPKGLRSAIRVARIVKEAVERNESDVRWFVFGDDDTVFFVDNLVRTLSKYDHDRWFYIGGISEVYEQNAKHSFDMAYGGGGFAISHSLAKVLARVLDSCLFRYAHLYGSDSRIYSCLAELGVGLTREPGFHQVDVRGNLFGMLAAHPLSPILSLHHLDSIDPIFPSMDRIRALKHLFRGVHVDPARFLQQTVCYDESTLSTISVAWGYAIQIYEGIQLLPDLLSVQKTFMPWSRSKHIDSSHYMFSTREFPNDSCKDSAVFFLKSVISGKHGVWSNYTRHIDEVCTKSSSLMNVKHIKVFSQKLDPDIEEMKAPRRQCCDVLSSLNESMVINIRNCGRDELISLDL